MVKIDSEDSVPEAIGPASELLGCEVDFGGTVSVCRVGDVVKIENEGFASDVDVDSEVDFLGPVEVGRIDTKVLDPLVTGEPVTKVGFVAEEPAGGEYPGGCMLPIELLEEEPLVELCFPGFPPAPVDSLLLLKGKDEEA